ncbi:MAG TPA: protein kinase [Polyangiaceae bacterium]|nr:protein kinase [Polyangiaceae bacterium]
MVTLIGSGGMGSVYEVEHVELGKRFVLKALLRSLTNRDDLVHRLRNEWRALGRLEHRNIVSVTDAGITTTGMPYFVMERLQGETLAARLRRDRRIPVRQAIAIAADVLEGLSAAHRIGIVHRDVKPPNVFLVTNKPAKLLDFGIAKVLDPKASQITGRGIAIGTPRYMAPEQATGEAVDARTDLYSVGLLLFEMIAGEGPFDRSRDPNELFLAHIAKTAPALTSIAPFAPPQLDSWLARLLAKKPSHRPDDAEAVAVALRAVAKELATVPPRATERDKDEPTFAGGPFDTLEAAQTVPSDGLSAQSGADTRTSSAPLSGSVRSPSFSGVEQSGQTVRLDALTSSGDVATRTAAPLPETPLPVADTPVPGSELAPRSGRRWARAGLVVASVAALGGGAVFSVRYANVAKGAAGSDTSTLRNVASNAAPRPSRVVAPAFPAVTPPALATVATLSPMAVRALASAPTPSPGVASTSMAAGRPEPPALTGSASALPSRGGALAFAPARAASAPAGTSEGPKPPVKVGHSLAKVRSAATHPTNSADSTMPSSGL